MTSHTQISRKVASVLTRDEEIILRRMKNRAVALPPASDARAVIRLALKLAGLLADEQDRADRLERMADTLATRNVEADARAHSAETTLLATERVLHGLPERITAELICCDAFDGKGAAGKHQICYWAGAARALVLDEIHTLDHHIAVQTGDTE